MFLFTAIINIFLLVLLYCLNITGIHQVSVISIIFMTSTSILYATLVYYLPRKVGFVTNACFVIIACFLTFGNIVYYNAKNSFFTISQIALLDELAGVSDAITDYLNPLYLLALIFPIIFIYVLNLTTTKLHQRYSNRILGVAVIALVAINISFYLEDSLLYTTVYSPIEYVQEYGIISFYAREVLPFSKINPKDATLDNQVLAIPQTENSGIFADKTNVVMVTAESFDDIAIDQELTPTLYKMSTDGIFFENYYTLTTNTNASEFSILTSVNPPIDNSHLQNYSGDLTTIPDIFNANDFCTFGFHLNSGSYYDRDLLYPDLYNFDYSYFADSLYPGASLNLARDEVLFEKSTKFIENQKCDNNFSYYMSMYGHLKYDIDSRPSARTDYQTVTELYPDNDVYLNGYLAYQMSLDQMFEEMIEYYDSKGVLDQTIFIVLGDHYPYALGSFGGNKTGEYSDSYVEQSFDGSEFETYNVPFMIYDPTSNLDNNSKYISNIDVMPTIADLFGFDYQYAEGKSAFDNSSDGVVKWLGVDNFGVLTDDFVYKDDGTIELEPKLAKQLEEDKLKAAKLYSLFYK